MHVFTIIMGIFTAPLVIGAPLLQKDLQTGVLDVDSFSDLISRELGKSATDFVIDIEDVFHELDGLIVDSVRELDSAHSGSRSDIQDKINDIKDEHLSPVLEIADKFIADLNKVLSSVPAVAQTKDPIAELIQALLGMTLQEFCQDVRDNIDANFINLGEAILSLEATSRDALPDVAEILNKVAGKFLFKARNSVIKPMLDTLNGLLDYRLVVPHQKKPEIVPVKNNDVIIVVQPVVNCHDSN